MSDQSNLLGHMVIWSISKGPHSELKISERCAELGFDVEISATSLGNAWRLATSEPLPGYTWTSPKGQRVEATLQKVNVQTQRRTANVREWHRIVPGYTAKPVLMSRLGRPKKPRERISWTTALVARRELAAEEVEQLERAVKILDGRVEQLMNNLDGNRVRAIVRGLLENDLQAVPLRGGVYYVPRRHEAHLKDLRSLFDVLEGCELEIVPLIDLGETRAMVGARFIAEVQADVADLHNRYQQYVDRGSIAEIVYAKAEQAIVRCRQRSYAYLMDLDIPEDEAAPVWAAHERLEALADGLERVKP